VQTSHPVVLTLVHVVPTLDTSGQPKFLGTFQLGPENVQDCMLWGGGWSHSGARTCKEVGSGRLSPNAAGQAGKENGSKQTLVPWVLFDCVFVVQRADLLLAKPQRGPRGFLRSSQCASVSLIQHKGCFWFLGMAPYHLFQTAAAAVLFCYRTYYYCWFIIT
jgi:hypothetical protein